jgi:hypothetical protein
MASKSSKITLPEILQVSFYPGHVPSSLPDFADLLFSADIFTELRHGFIGNSLNIYLWTLTIDETKVVLSGLQKYFTSETIDKRLKGWLLEDVMSWIEGAEVYMEEWGKHSRPTDR